MSTLPERLREVRLKHNLTQAQVAEYLSISRVSYTLYETGKNEPSTDSLKALANLYDTSIDYLVGRY